MEAELKEEINRVGIYNLPGSTHGVFGKQHVGTGMHRWTDGYSACALYHIIRIAFSLSLSGHQAEIQPIASMHDLGSYYVL